MVLIRFIFIYHLYFFQKRLKLIFISAGTVYNQSYSNVKKIRHIFIFERLIRLGIVIGLNIRVTTL